MRRLRSEKTAAAAFLFGVLGTDVEKAARRVSVHRSEGEPLIFFLLKPLEKNPDPFFCVMSEMSSFRQDENAANSVEVLIFFIASEISPIFVDQKIIDV